MLINVAKFFAIQGLQLLYNAVDSDKDGKLNKEEIEVFIKETRKILTDMKKKA